MNDELTVVADFRHQLRALPERRRRRRAPAAAVALIVALIAGGIALSTRDAPDALAVERHGDTITIRLVDASADPEKLTRELREKGIDATIVTKEVAPRHVGVWQGMTIGPKGGWTTAEPPAWMGRVKFEAREVTIPAGVPVELVLEIGVPRVE